MCADGDGVWDAQENVRRPSFSWFVHFSDNGLVLYKFYTLFRFCMLFCKMEWDILSTTKGCGTTAPGNIQDSGGQRYVLFQWQL